MMDKLERAARMCFKLPGGEAEEQARRYNQKFAMALRRNPEFAAQHLAKGDAWMRRHYTSADLQMLVRLKPQLSEPQQTSAQRWLERMRWHEQRNK